MDLKKINAETRIKTRNLNDFTNVTSNVYETVAMLSKRADQISSELKQELHHKIEDFRLEDSGSDDNLENKEQIEVSRYYEQLPKPYLMAIKEYLDGELVYRNEKLDHGNVLSVPNNKKVE